MTSTNVMPVVTLRGTTYGCLFDFFSYSELVRRLDVRIMMSDDEPGLFVFFIDLG